MAQLPDQLLAWLWQAAQPYQQPRVVYNDLASTLSRYPTLQPKTALYSFDNGQEEVLFCLYGMITADFRGAQYKYPIELFVPRGYGQPGAGIMAFVRPELGKGPPSSSLAVRPGQHVSADGRIYHPYLRTWGMNERSTIIGFLKVLQDVFAREPPIVARQQQQQPSSQPTHTPTPALPPKRREGDGRENDQRNSSQGPLPPPLPAKPGQAPRSASTSQAPQQRQASGPPLPPLPPDARQQPHSPDISRNGYASSQYQIHQNVPQRPAPRQQPPPSLPYLASQATYQQYNGDGSPISPLSPTYMAELPANKYERPAPPPQAPSSSQHPAAAYVQPGRSTQQATGYDQRQQHFMQQSRSAQPVQQYAQPQGHLHPQQPPGYPGPQVQPGPQPKKPAAPAPDLLTDPFDISLAAPAAPAPAPPIPPNPEKEHLLHLLSQSLVARAMTKIQQSQSAISPLTAQRHALLEAQSRLQSELQTLHALDNTLSTNENILHHSMRDCNAVVDAARGMPPPNIDELLIAPTVAAQQLWGLCADEAGIREALWALQQGVGAGRVSGGEFVRLTRSLAREAFLKMALMRKVARGLGLEVHGGGGWGV